MSSATAEATTEIFFAGFKPEEFNSQTGAPLEDGRQSLLELAKGVMAKADVEIDEWYVVAAPDPVSEKIKTVVVSNLQRLSHSATIHTVESSILATLNDHPGTQPAEHLLEPQTEEEHQFKQGRPGLRPDLRGAGLVFVVHEDTARHFVGYPYDWIHKDQTPIEPFVKQQAEAQYSSDDGLDVCVTTGENAYVTFDAKSPAAAA